MTDSNPGPEQTTPPTDRAQGITTNDPVAAWTPEKIGILQQLQRIFMPQAERQRDAAYKRQAKPGEDAAEQLRFVHYTSAEAALSIIKSKRLWMRNAVCVSDYREVQHGFDILNKFFSEPARMESFKSRRRLRSRRCESGDRFVQSVEARHLFQHFITSVSEHDDSEDFHGRLSMWRAFGLNTAWVAIVFTVPKKSLAAFALGVLFNPVAYLPESAVYAVMQEVLDN